MILPLWGHEAKDYSGGCATSTVRFDRYSGSFFISKDTLMLVWLSRFRYEVAVAHTDGLVGFLLLQQQLICTLFNEAPARRCRPMN